MEQKTPQVAAPIAAVKSTSTAHKLKNFGIGGISGMVATCFVQPIDMVKVQIQIKSGDNPGVKYGPLSTAKSIFADSGVKGFYRGIDSALMRQAVYTTARFGIFLNLSDYVKQQNNGANLSFAQKGMCSLAAGGLGSLVGTPADMILIRMQADPLLPVDQRRNYTSVFNACKRIPAEEGITSLWKGGVPTVTRAMALNLGMFTTYEESKERLGKMFPENKNATWVASSFFAGAVASTMSLPFDNAKTKMQKMKAGPDGVMPYKNIFDAMGKTVAQEGVSGLWVGLPTFIIRIAPHAMISLTIADILRAKFM